MDLKDTYNHIAEDWVKDHSNDSWWFEGTEKLLSYLQPGDSILDVGCGGGVKTKYLSEKGYDVTGIDFSEKMIEIAQREVPNAKFSVEDITQPLKLENQFDCVFAQAVLLHIPKKDIEQVMLNLYEVLKPGGYYYLAVKSLEEGQSEEKVIEEEDYGYKYERFFSFFNAEEMKRYIENLGMEIVFLNDTKGLKQNWVQIIAKKNN